MVAFVVVSGTNVNDGYAKRRDLLDLVYSSLSSLLF